MNDIKTGPEGSCGVLLNLSALTLYTGGSLAVNISVDTRPNETRSDEFVGGTDSWVR